jgi:lysophospholipase L1-like esterase
MNNTNAVGGMHRLACLGLALIALLGSGLAHAEPRAMQVFIASDSTAAEYAPELYPQLGWGMVLKCAFGDDVLVRNYAKGGRSTKSFATQGFFAQIEREIGKGDTLLIQFGHNDSKLDDPIRYTDPESDYKAWLVRYVEMARSKGAQPVLITPVTRRKFENGVLIDTHAAYAKAMRKVATESRTPLVDLTADSMRWISSLGDQASRQFYLVYSPGDRIPRFPDGHEDNTHFSEMGARKVAELVVARLVRMKLPISRHIKSIRPGLSRSTPLGGPTCSEPFTAAPALTAAADGARGVIYVTSGVRSSRRR